MLPTLVKIVTINDENTMNSTVTKEELLRTLPVAMETFSF